MIYELIANGTHGNNVALYKCWDSDKAFYKKVALTKEANRLVENEKRGYDWFFNATGKNNETRLLRKYFYEIDIPEFAGKRFPRNSIIAGNESIIEMVIDFYKRTWLSAEDFAVHGDLALCNFIIRGNSDIHVVDWEHFHLADKAYFGFDIFNMLFISLSHQSRKIDHIGRRTKDFLRQCYEQLSSRANASNQILEKPFQNSSSYLKRHQNRFGLSIDIEKKFILARCPQSELERLDLIVTRV